MNNAGLDEELCGIASAVISIQKLIIVWYVEFSRKQTTSQKARATFQKSLCLDLVKRYELSLCIAIHPSWLFVGAEFGWKICKV